MWAFYEDSESENSDQQSNPKKSNAEKGGYEPRKLETLDAHEEDVKLKEACLTSLQ